MQGMQRALSLIFPAQCLLCPAQVETTGGLCGTCWRDTPFLRGLTCETCGAGLPGQSDSGPVICDDCLTTPRPWQAGRAALSYRDLGRRLVLALKHGDRTELASPAARWMADAGRSILLPGTVLVPVPIHWSRLLSRRYNQAVELSRALSHICDLPTLPNALIRNRRTPVQDGMTAEARFRNMADAISVHPKHRGAIAGQRLCLIDDVMTSGATLTAATEALHGAGADHVFVLVLARVEKTH